MNGRDLGTYFVRVEFVNGQGYIEKMETGGRWLPKRAVPWGPEAPLESRYSPPLWESEQVLLDNIRFRLFENTCDCQHRQSLARAAGLDDDGEGKCGDELTIRSVTVLGPDGEPRATWTGAE